VCGWHASGRLDSGPGVPRKMVGQTKRDIDSGKSWPYFYSRLAHNASTTRYLHVPCKMKNEKKKKNTNSVEPGRRRVTSCVIWKTNRLAGGIASPTVYHNITLTSCPHLLTVCLLCLPTSGSCHSVRIQKFGTSYVTARVYLCPSSPGLCSTGLTCPTSL
jgi:hypothetical protein